MVTKKPLGTVEYIASGTDTLNCIALKFNITPNKLVELNKLFTHTIVPGQVLYVPVCDLHSSVRGSNSGVTSPLSSDAEYDKLPDADLARKATKPIERVLSSTSEEEEPVVVKFLKMNCRYITDGKGVVGGVMIVTPNNVMFDPHKSDPLVIENGCEEYGLICPMEEVVSVALYSDISHMKIKDALPSPGEWEDLSSEKDINPFNMLPSKEEKSKIPPMFMCIKVGKPMRKSFAVQPTAMVQQYVRKRKQPEYWFAVPQERVDHLYTFFVQWSPDVYGKDAKEQGFVVVEKDELTMIDNFFSEPSTKSWEIITVEEAKRRKSTCSYEEEEEEEEALEDFLPDLKQTSNLLEDMHIEKLAHRLPARVQGYPWHLVYSTRQHGTSLKTLYRNLASLDCPVLLVIKDMDSQVFGTYATHPFRLSDHYYGTGETFLFTFNPDFKAFKWSGENSYFINGDIGSLEVGGGGGRFGLWLDSDLYHGRSNSCSTFNNDILSKKEDFIVQDIEVWAFA
ncbi:nuclear receptor coactivator 7 isoform X5 [Mixophyes fleayi]|uniref:nuclear receptor coactivator 7 isoform X5 n=1 Tax=Mixophyes fleayi TaxID=3061075 RepID=UPI003F4D7AFA